MSWWVIAVVAVVGFLIFKFLVKPFFKIIGFAVLAVAVYFLFFH